MKSINAEEDSSIKVWSTPTLSGMREETIKDSETNIWNDPEENPSMQYPRSQVKKAYQESLSDTSWQILFIDQLTCGLRILELAMW